VWLFMRDDPAEVGQMVDGEATPTTSAKSAEQATLHPRPERGAGRPAQNAGPESEQDSFSVTEQHDERQWTTPQILRSGSFWKLSVGYMFAYGMLWVMLIYQFPFIVNRGFSSQTAALIVSGYALFAALGRFAAGWLADRTNANALATANIWLAAIGVIILIMANDLPAVWLYAIIGGAGIGGLSALQAVVTAQQFGRRSFGTASGLQNPLNQVAAAIAVPFAGFMYDATGTYNVAMMVVVVAAMAASVSLLLLPRGQR
jgi:cyanate permease